MRRRRRRGCLGRLIGLLLIAALALGIFMLVQSRILHIVPTEVYLTDLPFAFDGTRVLFLSDLHMGAYGSADSVAALVEQLQTFYPDIVLLGGDYLGADPFTAADFAKALSERDAFFTRMGWLYAPLGKFGVRGNHDRDGALAESMALGGATLLNNQVVRLEKEGAHLYLAGLEDWSTGQQALSSLAGRVRSGDCVIALSHDPSAFPMALREQTEGGGMWFDLMLSGHTHGGQVNIPTLSRLVTPKIARIGYQTGWTRQGGSLLLVSNGVGTTALPLRLSAPAQAHLLTLRRATK